MLTITQSDQLQGEILIPGDKSISHRAVMFSSLAKGTTQISGFLPGEDCLSTIRCFRQMGVSIEQTGSKVTVKGKGWFGLDEPVYPLDVGNSGTTIRLMMGILSTQPFHSVLIGDESIAKRPMDRVALPLRAMGSFIDGRKEGGYTPLSIRGRKLKGIEYQLPVASAQVKSAILLAGIKAEGRTTIVEPYPSRDHTERMFSHFGVQLFMNDNVIALEGGQELVSPEEVTVPGDISSAAFFLVAGAIVPNSQLLLKNVGLNPTRIGIIHVLKRMGAKMQEENYRHFGNEPAADLIISSSSLKGTVIEGSEIPTLIDEIPVIAVLATQAEGITIIRDAEELKVKETNRIDTVVSQLKKMGAKIEGTEDGMIIEGPTPLTGDHVDSFGDHRIGMAMAIAGLVAKGETTISNAGAINVSFPNFADILSKIRIK
ncbi:3-phosphoshikimate 1-carboxyvinyltransferase [Microaerobacter geothermalis]|uniref:3-phosphoshikimate 1-carboxyvinyltransferase n=1 Tax=Microaerobacter geothermalis TaxID=674972 RepID=UPI001F3345B6|nr:3-phosphoshikimate 1-carboxyvinyltransferase [Microaerobacter geothermalis]MCF6093372.1 3-phosphoshikimate 1-carboxyvinyltransferase [Microaerobacter geothermalis]